MSLDFHVVIPARYNSSRLPGKLLMDINGKTVLERVYYQVIQANPSSVVIATDNDTIAELAKTIGADVVMTSPSHQSGTDRVAEVVAKKKFYPEAIIVNVQGDEPFIPPQLISQVAESLANSSAPMATLCWPIEEQTMHFNPNIVKVVRDAKNYALYFSRSPIPFNRDNLKNCYQAMRHIGLYAYRAAFLLDVVTWPVCDLEATEALEQLRVLWAGYSIQVENACVQPLQDINTLDDLEQAILMCK